MGDAYVEIGPSDADYARLAVDALTQDEYDERRRRWQEGDEPLRREFLDFLARRGTGGLPGSAGRRLAGGLADAATGQDAVTLLRVGLRIEQ